MTEDGEATGEEESYNLGNGPFRGGLKFSGSKTFISLTFRLKGLLGAVTRVKKRRCVCGAGFGIGSLSVRVSPSQEKRRATTSVMVRARRTIKHNLLLYHQIA